MNLFELDFLVVALFIIGIISGLQYHEHNRNNIRHDERKFAWICAICAILIVIIILSEDGTRTLIE